jgi:hypothetical protein
MKLAWCLPLILVLDSCGTVGRALRRQPAKDPDNAEVVVNPSNDPNVPSTASLRLPGIPDAPTGAAPVNGMATGTASSSAASGSSLFDFSSAFANPSQNRNAHWRRSGTDAIDEAKRRGLPLLIFFAHHSSPPALEMETALSNTADLTRDDPRFIALRMDFYDKDTADSEYYKSLRDRYKIRGYPVLIATLPDGTELKRQAGCNKDWKNNVNYWLDDAAHRAKSGIDAHRQRLAAKKYRLWKNKDGQEIFARLESQDANKLVFTGEWGQTIRTFTNRLSEEDRQRIESRQL